MHTVTHIELIEDSAKISPNGRYTESEIAGDLLVAHTAKQTFKKSRLLRGEFE